MIFQYNDAKPGLDWLVSTWLKTAHELAAVGYRCPTVVITACLTERGFAAGNARQQRLSGIIARKKGARGALPDV